MLENFMYSVNAVFPIFLLVLLGALLKRIGMINDAFCEAADKLVFRVALPVMLFLDIAGCRMADEIDSSLILFLVIAVSAEFLVISLLAVLLVKDKTKRGSLVQGICRSNFAILGVPLAENMFGGPGVTAIAISMPFVILMFNAYSVVLLSAFSNSKKNRFGMSTVVGILKNVVTNPLIIGVVLALPFMFFRIDLPTAVNKTLGYVSDLATPLALFSLGAGFKAESLRGRAGYAVFGALGKTVLMPAVFVTLAALLGLRGPSLGVVLICFGSPTAVSSYIMAKKMDNDDSLAAQILLLSTLVCVFTIFAGVFILKSLSLI